LDVKQYSDGFRSAADTEIIIEEAARTFLARYGPA
jgi:hypothetical protein